MEYISRFNVKLKNIKEFTQEEKEQIKEDLMDITNIPESYVNYLIDKGETEFESKWYDREKELTIVSRLHPKLKISIDIEGENREDYSKLFVFEGKTQTIQAVVSIMYEEDNKLRKD